MAYQTVCAFEVPAPHGTLSPDSIVASSTVTVSVNGSDAGSTTAALTKLSFEAGAALAVAGTSNMPQASAAIVSARSR
jgi:hypothetical protein